MEKTKLVRTFGTALATATLSFGLFAAPALAVERIDVKGSAVSIEGEDKGDTVTKNDRVDIEIPATVSSLADGIKAGTMTFKASDGTFDQELVLSFVPNNDPAKGETALADLKTGTFAFFYDTDDNGQLAITKIVGKAFIDDDMLEGKWTLSEIKLWNSTNKIDDNLVATITSDASFVVDDTTGPANMAADIETVSVIRQVVARGWKGNQYLMVNAVDGNIITGATATYVNPAGVEKDYTLTNNSGINIAQLVSERLPIDVEGDYTLKKLAAKRTETINEGRTVKENGALVTSVVYDDVDLSQGDYVVTKTGVEAMIRLYNPWTGEHIYTNDGVEQLAAVAAGWVYEGLAWYAPVNGLYPDAVAPVYRVYNQYNGEHHYTTSSVEALALVAAGWTDEGVGFYSTSKGDARAQAVYRLFNPFATVGTHHYTIGEDEYKDLQAAGWKGEGVGWYGVKGIEA